MKARKSTDKIRVDEVVYEDTKDMAQVMNSSFKQVFTNELDFKRTLNTHNFFLNRREAVRVLGLLRAVRVQGLLHCFIVLVCCNV